MNQFSLENKFVAVTGADSMIGRAVIEKLKKYNAKIRPIPHRAYDLMDEKQASMALYPYIYNSDNTIPRTDCFLIHLATSSGNIGFNQKYPADVYYNTTKINLLTLHYAHKHNYTKVVSVISSCAIGESREELLESDLWIGPPNETVECHGLAKRTLDAYSRMLRKQNGFNAVTCILQNSFGPYDSVDLNKTKVVMSLIKKYVDAKRQNLPEVVNWGTGSPLREFVYCKDAAEGIIQTLMCYNEETPINIASDEEVSIRDLSDLIKYLVGYTGKIVWDTTKADGQMRKKLNTKKMHTYLDLKFTNLSDALKETIKWYEQNY